MKQMKIRLHTAFVFNIRVELISEGTKVTELRQYILNFIGLCMFLNLPNVTLIFKDSCFVYLNDKVTLFVLGENHITVRESFM